MSTQLNPATPASFWRDMRDGDHVCQVYSDDAGFLDSLTGFIGHGLWTGESAVVIATPEHLEDLEARLRASGLDLGFLRSDDRFLTLSPDLTLERFMVDGWPDPARFDAALAPAIARARGKGRAVRAFGEMVAQLWQEKRFEATVRLEQIWRDFSRRESLQVLCAYPRRSFSQGPAAARQGIHAAHVRTVAD